MYAGLISTREVSVLAVHLPRGSAVAERIGGPGAITAEVEASYLVEHAIYLTQHGQSGSSKAPPKMRDYPKAWDDATSKEEKKLSRLERHLARHSGGAEG